MIISAMSPKNRARTTQLRRKQIMDAAIKLFDVQGFRSTTVEQIADCAGISKGLVYKYFKNKKEILLSFHEIVEQCEEEVCGMPTATDALRLFASRLLLEEEATGFQPPKRILITETIRGELEDGNGENYLTNDYGRRFLGPLIERGQRTGEFRDGDPEELGDIFWHTILGYVVQIMYQHPPLEARPNIEAILDIVRKRNST